MNKITIIGGGLSGLALGIALRNKAVPVELFEGGEYPRHRVCGEFISGKGQAILGRLGLDDDIVGHTREAETAAFFSEDRCRLRWTIPQTALTISRWNLDAALAKKFEATGGVLRCGTRWTGDHLQPGIVRATGRRCQPQAEGVRWFGLKAHATNVSMDADLEMHFQRNCYVGLCRLAGERVNVCGLFWREAHEQTARSGPRALLTGAPGSELRNRLERASWIEDSFCSVAGLPIHIGLERMESAAVGDAVTMLPPVTGNGMSFAFECAEIAAEPLSAFAHGTLNWIEAQEQLRSQYQRRFGRRVRGANWLHQVLLQAPKLGLHASTKWPWLWRSGFALTRC